MKNYKLRSGAPAGLVFMLGCMNSMIFNYFLF